MFIVIIFLDLERDKKFISCKTMFTVFSVSSFSGRKNVPIFKTNASPLHMVNWKAKNIIFSMLFGDNWTIFINLIDIFYLWTNYILKKRV